MPQVRLRADVSCFTLVARDKVHPSDTLKYREVLEVGQEKEKRVICSGWGGPRKVVSVRTGERFQRFVLKADLRRFGQAWPPKKN